MGVKNWQEVLLNKKKKTSKNGYCMPVNRATRYGYKKPAWMNFADRLAFQKGPFIFFSNRKKRSFAKSCVPFRSKSAMRLPGLSKSKRINTALQKR